MQNFRDFTAGGMLAFARIAAPAAVAMLTLYLSTLVTLVDFDAGYVVLAVLAAVLAQLMVRPAFGSLERAGEARSTIGLILGGWCAVIGLLLLLGYATKMSEYFSRRAFFVWFLIGSGGLVVAYYSLRRVTSWLIGRSDMLRRSLIVGVNDIGIKLATEIERRPELGMKVQGFFEDRGRERFGDDFHGEVLGRLSEVADYVRREGAEVVFIALPIRHVQRVLDLLDELHDTTVSIYFLPDIFVFDLIQSQVHTIGGLPAIALCETPFSGFQGLLKRVLDVTVAAAALVVLSPLLLVVAVLIRLTSPGSIVFKQRRYGLDGREIVVYKFRTMQVSEDGDRVVQAERSDPRLTPIGGFLRKYSIDELPQLVNVLQGRMSLVGPRPHAVAHNEEYRKLIKGYMFRHKVLPGVTGWAQVNGFRGRTEHLDDMQARVSYDLHYLRNWSIGFDIKILFLTALNIAHMEKAY